MAHWKYHLENGDLVVFWWENEDGARMEAAGTVKAIGAPLDFDPDEVESYDDVPLNDFEVKILSGNEEVLVPMDDLIRRTKEEDRDTDIPHLSERFRFDKGVSQV